LKVFNLTTVEILIKFWLDHQN